MAKEYVQINEDESKGLIAISTHVLETIAKTALEEEEGVYLASKITRDALSCKIIDKKLCITIKIKLDYGLNVSTKCEAVQNKVRQAISQYAGIPLGDIQIEVVGFIF